MNLDLSVLVQPVPGTVLVAEVINDCRAHKKQYPAGTTVALSVKCGSMEIVGFVNSVIVVENLGTITIDTDYKNLTWLKIKNSAGLI